MKKTIVIGIVVLCVGLMYQYPHAMLNPGDLVEGHQNISDNCLSCHKPFWGISNDKCISCHKLSDIGKDTLMLKNSNAAGEKVLFHQHLSNQKCTSCHTDHEGLRPEISISNFSHEILNAADVSKCNGCHFQPSDNLHKQLTTACSNCHNTKGWTSSVIFNHGMILSDAKENCSLCHEKPNDSFHQLLEDNCDKCHSTSKWMPSTFDHSAYFQLDGDHNAKCKTCHTTSDFNVYTCYGCHEHSEGKILEEHDEQDISNISNCVSCHRSGNEDDIRRNGNSNKESEQNKLDNNNNHKESEEDKKKEHRKKENDDD